MANILKVCKYIKNGGNFIFVPFPNPVEQLILDDYQYTAKRMGGAPSITAKAKHRLCLDDIWTDEVCVVLNGERYFIKDTPGSLKNNTSELYEHDITFVSERSVLDGIFFIDSVYNDPNDPNPQDTDKYVSNNTTVTFMGTIHEFAGRLNSALRYSGLGGLPNGNGYYVTVDEGITSDPKLMSFTDKYFSEVLQEIFNTYKLPYYFKGKEIHIGYTGNVLTEVFEYGLRKHLLSVEKQNANKGYFNRMTGVGSSDNLPHYYPNTSAHGSSFPHFLSSNAGEKDDSKLSISNSSKFNSKLPSTKSDADVSASKGLVYHVSDSAYIYNLKLYRVNPYLDTANDYEVKQNTSNPYLIWHLPAHDVDTINSVKNSVSNGISLGGNRTEGAGNQAERNERTLWLSFTTNSKGSMRVFLDIAIISGYDEVGNAKCSSTPSLDSVVIYENENGVFSETDAIASPDHTNEGNLTWTGGLPVKKFCIECNNLKADKTYYVRLNMYLNVNSEQKTDFEKNPDNKLFFKGWSRGNVDAYWSKIVDGEYRKVTLSEYGIKLSSSAGLSDGDMITRRFVQTSGASLPSATVLMPSIYRQSKGAERFYNAKNSGYSSAEKHLYEIDSEGTTYLFENIYSKNNPHEGKNTYDDIKPTIKGMTNANGNRMDVFLDVAFDTDDNDDYNVIDGETSAEYSHPYFFVKLAKTSGRNNSYGFNLFDQACSDGNEMTVEMTSGACGACKFTIILDENTGENTVQVNGDGTLMRDDDGNVKFGAPQERQNDTRTNEVWICLKKEDSTYRQLMPNAKQKLRPKAVTDTFVYTNIEMPIAYILDAEDRLSKAIVEDMWKNNSEKFNFSITFSRIYLAQRPDIARQIDENVRIPIKYNGKTIYQYVSSYTYSVSSNEALPEIKVELSDEVSVNQNSFQAAISEIKGDFMNAIGSYDILRSVAPYFLRKDIRDSALARIDFLKGLEIGNYTSGNFGSGGVFGVNEDGSSYIEADFMYIRRKATFTELTIQELRHVGGQLIISPAAAEVSRVVEFDDFYRCFFNTTGGQTNAHIYNQFVVGDCARCQSFNEAWDGDDNSMPGGVNRYYWRLVVGVGNGYIDLSKTDCDAGSDAPQANDKVCQLGNRNDVTRQNAQILSAYGVDAPSKKMYQHITCWKYVYDEEGNILTNPNTGKPLGTPLYSLDGKEVSSEAYNPETGRMQVTTYGDFYFGDRDKESYVKWDTGKKELSIKGKLSIGSTYNGEELGNYINNKNNQTKNDLQDKIDALQEQVDGVIEAFNGEGAPTLNNYPASGWTTDEERKRHDRDIYTDITPYVDDVTTPTSGQSWKWYYNSPTDYGWTKIADSEAVRALQLAQMSVTMTDVLYKQDTSQTNAPALPTVNSSGVITDYKGWATNAPAWEDGKYIWQTTYVKRGDGSVTFSDPVCISGKNGSDGVGIDHMDEEYYLSTSATTPTGGSWKTEANKPTWEAGKYMWTRTHVYYTDGTDEIVGERCVTGASGTSVLAQYSSDGTNWHLSFVSGDIWMRTSSDGGNTWTNAIRIVGQNGQDGTNGTDGKWRKFQFAKNNSATTAPTTGWQDDPMTAATGEYVWMRSGMVVPPATTPATWEAATRITGDKGDNGESVYMLDLSNEVDAIECNADGNVIGSYPTSVASVWKGSTKITTGITYSIDSTSGITASIDSSGNITLSNITAERATVNVKAVVGGVTLVTSMSVYKVRPGANGEPATIYMIEPSVDNITKKADGTLSATSVTCSVYKVTGNSARVLTNDKALTYLRLPDGATGALTLTNGTASAVNILADTEAVIFELKDGNTLLDRERIPVVADGNDLVNLGNKIDSFDYLKEALKGNTVINGGLVLSSLFKLGTWTGSGDEATMSKVYAGMNGIYGNDKTIAAWFGGDMIDIESAGNSTNPLAAKTLFRMDGTGYVAGGRLSWDASGNITLGSGIKIELGDTGGIAELNSTLKNILSYMDNLHTWITPVNSSLQELTYQQANEQNVYAIKVKTNFFATGGISALGANFITGGGGGGGATSLSELLDVSVGSQTQGQVLGWDGNGHWVPMSYSDTKNTAGSMNLTGAGVKLYIVGAQTQTPLGSQTYSNSKCYIGTDDCLYSNGEKVLTSAGLSGSSVSITYNGKDPISPSSGIISLGGLATKVKVGDTSYDVSSGGVISLPAYPTTLPASDVYDWAKASSKPSYSFSEIGSKPTTLAGYGITDAKISGGVITLGSNTITPITSLAGYATQSWVEGKGYLTSLPSHTHSYLPLTGGSLSGNLNLLVNQYTDTANTGSLNLNNSDIYGVNSIKFADLSDGAAEGLQWYRDATHVDSFWVRNGVMYFTPNRTWGGSATNNVVIHSGNISSYAITSHQSLANYVDKTSAQEISGVKTHTAGLKVSGRIGAGGDDEGIVIGKAVNNYAGLILGDPNGVRSVFYLSPANTAFWRYNNGTANYDIGHPSKSGTIALTSDISSAVANYLPLSGGTLTGTLYVATNLGIFDATGNGLLVYKPNGWTGVTNTQWGLGAIDIQGVIRSNNSSLIHYRNGVGNSTIWDSGNDGSGSGLDADLLDGKHNGAVTAKDLTATETETVGVTVATAKANMLNAIKGTVFGNVTKVGENFISNWADDTHTVVASSKYSVINVTPQYNGYSYGQYLLFLFGSYNPKLVGRNNYEWTAMKTFAFLDDNVASATRLQGTYSLWGQSFYGNNVSGNMTGVGNINTTGANGRYIKCNGVSHEWGLHMGTGGENHGIYEWTTGCEKWLLYFTNSNTILNHGNVGIGLSPAYKLDVNGDTMTRGWLRTTGKCGWYSEGYGGGWYMSDTTWLRTFNAKSLYTGTGQIYTETSVRIGGCTISWDSTNNALKFDKTIYSTGGVSGLGQSSVSGGTSGDYLPLTGGSLSGALSISGGLSVANGSVSIGGTAEVAGAFTTWGYAYNKRSSGRAWAWGGGTCPHYVGNDSSTVYLWTESSLDVKFGTNNTEKMRITKGGSVWIGTTNGGSYKFYVNGSCGGASAWTNASDMRLKNKLSDVNISIENIANAPLFMFTWKDANIDDKTHIGTSAQYWKSIVPEVVVDGLGGYYGMEYSVTALIAAITTARTVRNHEQRIVQLEKNNKELRKENEELRNMLNELKVA